MEYECKWFYSGSVRRRNPKPERRRLIGWVSFSLFTSFGDSLSLIWTHKGREVCQVKFPSFIIGLWSIRESWGEEEVEAGVTSMNLRSQLRLYESWYLSFLNGWLAGWDAWIIGVKFWGLVVFEEGCDRGLRGVGEGEERRDRGEEFMRGSWCLELHVHRWNWGERGEGDVGCGLWVVGSWDWVWLGWERKGLGGAFCVDY